MKNKIFCSLFLVVWISIVVLNFVWPKKMFSEQENRPLATIPSTFNLESFIDGTYLANVDDYINDHFIGRNVFLKLNSWWEISIMKKKENNGVYVGKDGYLFEKFTYSEKEKENVNNKEEAISTFASKCQLPVRFLLIPNSIYCNSDKLPDNVSVKNQEQIIEEIYQNTKGTDNIQVAAILKEESMNKQLYFKTDHHINSDGAYLVYMEYCKNVDLEAEPMQNFERKLVSENFLGTFDSKAQIFHQEKDSIWVYENENNREIKDVEYDKERSNKIVNEKYLTTKDQYSYFLNGNNSRVKMVTNEVNGKKLLVLKDSYAHILAQFLCQNYEEIHMIDPRYYKGDLDQYIQENGITDILLLYNVNTFLTDASLQKLLEV